MFRQIKPVFKYVKDNSYVFGIISYFTFVNYYFPKIRQIEEENYEIEKNKYLSLRTDHKDL